MNRKVISGFSLIELMIVVAVAAIIAAIAIPSYQESVKKSKRADAQGALYSLASALEREFTETNSYCDVGTNAEASCGGADGDSGAPTNHGTTVPLDGGAAYYNLTLATVTTTTYTIRATRTGSMAGDQCGDFTLTSTNVQGITNVGGGGNITGNGANDAGKSAQRDCWR